MNGWKGLAILFGLLTFGGIMEIMDIYKNPDYVEMRVRLISIGVGITLLFASLSLYFYNKGKKKQNRL